MGVNLTTDMLSVHTSEQMIYHCAMQTLCDTYLLHSHRDRSFSVIYEREPEKDREVCTVSELLKKRQLTLSPPKKFPQRLKDHPSYLAFGASEITSRWRCWAEKSTAEPLLASFTAQRQCDFGPKFRLGGIWAHWQRNAGAADGPDAGTSHLSLSGAGWLDGVSMGLKVSCHVQLLLAKLAKCLNKGIQCWMP